MEIIAQYRRKQFFILSLIFVVCSVIIVIAEYKNEKNQLLNKLENSLNLYSDLIESYIDQNHLNQPDSIKQLAHFTELIPNKDIRITLVDLKGKVFYDNRIKDISKMENHRERPEIKMALVNQIGSNIRVSATDKIKYYYFAKKCETYFIRVSIEYNKATAQLLEPKKFPIFFIVLIFFISTIVVVFVTDKFGKSVTLLKKFTVQAINNQSIEDFAEFPKNELGYIGQDILEIYEKMNKAKIDLLSEKEKLIRHLNLLEEGIAIFTREKKLIANNSTFIQFISHISDSNVFSPENFFQITAFSPLFKFIDSQISSDSELLTKHLIYEININKESKVFLAKTIVFQDKSIEIIISDITRPAKRKILKQQLTENIAHELKTPVSSIKGFLETIIDKKPEEKKLFEFINKAYSQTCRLTNLINDISLLTKIEEAGNLYQIEKVNISQIVKNVIDDLAEQIQENELNLNINITEQIEFEGNSILMYSIFRNLIENAISHAGKNITIRIEKLMEDSDFYYFTFFDSGPGVPEQDLSRLFERFYRVDKGRDHKKGGTGLGLAIVKNAILFHKGEISVKNRKEGGLEFLFSFKKIISAN